MTVKIKRIYDDPASADGYRVLVDRIWPRGVSKERAHLDEWLKEIAPTTALRKWFNHEESKWSDFRSRYRSELDSNASVGSLKEIIAAHSVVTLLYSAHSEEQNQAVVLREYLG